MVTLKVAMNKPLSLMPVALLLFSGVTFAQKQKAPPAPDLAKAQARAEMHNKRVLVLLNPADEDLAAALKRNRSLSRKLRYEFETVSFRGADALKKWRWQSDASGAVVLAADGKELGRFTHEQLVGDKALPLLEPLFCKPVDAKEKLAAAMVEAKKTGRNIFIRFDAPW